ncbi:putative LLM family oxidoreductase [Acholeplasma morum]|uniref:LLM class flavin-dependent oxidoreductase n=1 Tax=Paracholeplasma morum TaxID=264637 RepID=UPI00195AAC20|nr:LLM class flavin-dependent oxidoreductase [Paracholeplasma morum]MBM7453946.1 putative LLM family oxidoreductase [Paracholeplasma morum]
MEKFELGITTFAEVMIDPITGYKPTYDERIRQIVEEIKLADEVGLDYFGVGEHHRSDYAASAPHMILAAAAPLTKHIKLGSAVTVLSSEDPVRVYQNFATLNALSNGRAEIMAGRGSFIESFPLFGYNLRDYDLLFKEKLELLIKIRDNEKVSFDGKTRHAIQNLGVYPRTKDLTISVAVGGTPESVVRAANYGLPLFLAIIGGSPRAFKGLVNLYDQVYQEKGHDPLKRFVSVHSHGFIADTFDEAFETYYPSMEQAMNTIGKERGWSRYTKASYEASNSMEGALFVGDPEYVAKKILHLRKTLGINRFALHVPVGALSHDKVLHAIRLLGTKVKPLIEDAIKKESI